MSAKRSGIWPSISPAVGSQGVALCRLQGACPTTVVWRNRLKSLSRENCHGRLGCHFALYRNRPQVDVGRRMIDLADIERAGRMDVSWPRFEPLDVLRIGGSFLRDLLGAEQPGYPAGDGEIGRTGQAGLLAASADLGHDGSERRSLQLQPLFPQCRDDDRLDALVKALLASAIQLGQQRRHCPIDAVARQQIVDLAGREAQLGRGPVDCRASWPRAVENPVELTSDATSRRPCFVGMRRGGCRFSVVQSVRQSGWSVKSLAKNRGCRSA